MALRTMPSVSGASHVRSEIRPVSSELCRTNFRRSGRSSSRCGRKATQRREADRASRRRGECLRRNEPEHGCRHAMHRADREAGQAQGHRVHEQQAADVIAPVEDQHCRAHHLDRLEHRYCGRDQHRCPEIAGAVEDRIREEGKEDDQPGGDDCCGRFEHEGEVDDPAETPPVLARRVPESELDERLVTRQLEHQRDERHRSEDDRELAGRRRPEHTKDNERTGDAERRRGIDASRGDEPPAQHCAQKTADHSARSRSGCLRTNRRMPRQCHSVRRVRKRWSVTAWCA